MSTVQTINVKHPSSASNNIVLDSSGNATVAGTLTSSGTITSSGTVVMSSSFLRNRIINGDMRIDQRNAGAAVTINTLAGGYTVDRWFATGKAAAGVFTVQRLSTPVPAGFTNILACTVTTSATPGSTDAYVIGQFIEGFNVADLAWGSASAQTVTLSFRVYSSLTGTFGGSIANNAANRCYPFSFSIGSANTWTTISVTIPGDTTGTWLTDNSAGIKLYLDLGSGASLRGTAGSWGSTFYTGVTGGTNVIATNGATFYLTGVMLEIGSVQTPFERRQYGQELMLCQRYYQKSYPIDTAPGDSSGLGLAGGTAMNNGTNNVGNNGLPIALRVNMRGTPTITTYPAYGGAAGSVTIAKAATPQATYVGTADFASSTGFKVFSTASGSGGTAGTATELLFQYTASAEL